MVCGRTRLGLTGFAGGERDLEPESSLLAAVGGSKEISLFLHVYMGRHQDPYLKNFKVLDSGGKAFFPPFIYNVTMFNIFLAYPPVTKEK